MNLQIQSVPFDPSTSLLRSYAQDERSGDNTSPFVLSVGPEGAEVEGLNGKRVHYLLLHPQVVGGSQ